METVLVVPIVLASSLLPQEKVQARELAKQREDMLSKGYTIKETKLVTFNDAVYAHYVMRKE